MLDQGGKDGDNSAGRRAGMARLSAILMILPGSMAAGWLLGSYILDPIFHSYPWGSIVMTLLGGGAGFYEIVRILIPAGGSGGNLSK
jgi:F0F1-type ATP synthase assembly protein I